MPRASTSSILSFYLAKEAGGEGRVLGVDGRRVVEEREGKGREGSSRFGEEKGMGWR